MVIHTIPTSPSVTVTTVLDILIFHYFGGLILASRNRYHEAENFFYACLLIPASTVGSAAKEDFPSAIQCEAYKKYILLSCLNAKPNSRPGDTATGSVIAGGGVMGQAESVSSAASEAWGVSSKNVN